MKKGAEVYSLNQGSLNRVSGVITYPSVLMWFIPYYGGTTCTIWHLFSRPRAFLFFFHLRSHAVPHCAASICEVEAFHFLRPYYIFVEAATAATIYTTANEEALSRLSR